MLRKELEGNFGKVEESQGKIEGKVSNQFILLNKNYFVQDTQNEKRTDPIDLLRFFNCNRRALLMNPLSPDVSKALIILFECGNLSRF